MTQHRGHREERGPVECGGLTPLFLRLQFPSMTENLDETDNRKTSGKREQGCRTQKKTPRLESGRAKNRQGCRPALKKRRPGRSRDALFYSSDSTRAVLHLSRKKLVMGQNAVSA